MESEITLDNDQIHKLFDLGRLKKKIFSLLYSIAKKNLITNIQYFG
jgi:hypothetical protein